MTLNRSAACIGVDWGTTNRRAWLLDDKGGVIAGAADDQGILAVAERRFAASLRAFLGPWLQLEHPLPIVMAGMIGSRSGWREVPYFETPCPLAGLAGKLARLEPIDGGIPYIVPGIVKPSSSDDGPDVMRGEECQLLAAVLARKMPDGFFLLPGTHSKWAVLEDGALVDFRTYMTGELFDQLRRSGTLAQVMEGDAFDEAAFDHGVGAAIAAQSSSLLHLLFGARALALCGRLEPKAVPSHVSGLLVGAEMADALAWMRRRRESDRIIAVGSVPLLRIYGRAAELCAIRLDKVDSASVLPAALFELARSAGLIEPSTRSAPQGT